jgi:uncharacterized GH25 family protein
MLSFAELPADPRPRPRMPASPLHPSRDHRRTLFAAAMLACLLAVPRLLWAHDFWIEPETFRPQPGARVGLHLYVGQHFAGESIPYFPDRFERYVSVGPAGEQPIPGVLGDDPAGAITAAAPGLYVIGLRTRPETVSFDSSEEFEQYLRMEGLERNLALHRQRYKPGKKIQESYFRCAKSLIATRPIGDTDTGTDRALGLPLELIAVTNPYRSGQGTPLRLQLQYHGKPLTGALVMLSNKRKPLPKLTARTDGNGMVQFDPRLPGPWLATSVHMVPAPLFAAADWNSLWASLTFEWRPAAARK